jgi:hypothetical protein
MEALRRRRIGEGNENPVPTPFLPKTNEVLALALSRERPIQPGTLATDAARLGKTGDNSRETRRLPHPSPARTP